MGNPYFQRTVNKESDEDLEVLKLKYTHFYQKFDGTHADIEINTDGIKILTRDGKDITHLVPYIVEELNSKDMDIFIGSVLATELVYLSDNPKEVWGKTREVLGRKEYKEQHKISCIVYDIYRYQFKDITNEPYSFRNWKILGIGKRCNKYVEVPKSYSIENLKFFYEQEVLGKGFEGVMLYNEETYVPFNKTFSKLKPKIEVDCVISKIHLGKKGTKLEGRVGAFECYVYTEDGKTKIDIGKVPTMPEEERLYWDNYIRDKGLVADDKGVIIPLEELVIQAKAFEVTEKMKLRFPSYMRRREDKKGKECTEEQLR